MEKNRFWLVLMFAVAVYVVLGVYADLGKLLTALETFDWRFMIVLLGLTTLGYLIRFVRWDFFLKGVGVNLDLKDNHNPRKSRRNMERVVNKGYKW